MKLSKQEQAVVIGNTIMMLGGHEEVTNYVDPQKLAKVSDIHNELYDNTTPRERREAMISLLNKTMDEFVENK
ncbi:hypothetical protein CN498_20655 [Bacillus thuringiensis]|uniref:Conserved domain protein n=1 Tax=Bacillus cereus (strain G9842) TaxID=405531 RepID=B7IKH5_BACC2|nr:MULTISPECIES: hypothetical protein [Bacillus cereus group]MBS9803119.1 hypothetical protein [Bacillus toyonensis]ACK97848.1 conserved domain protein [Bacillus cereus G9842]MCY8954802.1 hypothetical protein [Bacillus cereus]MDF9529483.1 hypothetical protein [Bacillus cereus]MDG1578348.1 hypothetical protein [Bacillus cereus]